jgi:hypothetical protein
VRTRCGPPFLVVATLLAGPVLCSVATGGRAEPTQLRITFQPDCFRAAASSTCATEDKDRLDPGPQIAIWLESADGGRFVDTILVTNLTAVLGIGNRVGYWKLPSGPKFPYGKRVMVLPVWAHRRGKLYDNLVNQAGVQQEFSTGGLEPFSSPEPYFCRPLEAIEVVDAITCPTPSFHSAKGRFFDPAKDLAREHLDGRGMPLPYVPPAKSYYPPRNELRTFTVNDCDDASERADCPVAARAFAGLNDLDDVAAATPAYGRIYSKTWLVPDQVPDGDYALFLEINKEYDQNQFHAHPARPDHLLEGFGILTNLGQPSVVYRVPFRLSRDRVTRLAVTNIVGYGDWDGVSGTLHPPDRTISDAPGSGAGRLLSISIGDGAPLIGRVHLTAGPLAPGTAPAGPLPVDGGPSDAGMAPEARAPHIDGAMAGTCREQLPVEIPAIDLTTVGAEQAEMAFLEPSDPSWREVSEYQARYWNDFQTSEEAFRQGTPLPTIQRSGPGQRVIVSIPNLKEQSSYTVGIRPQGSCLKAAVTYASFRTPRREFKQLSGCFIATAAWAWWQPDRLEGLRQARDWMRSRSAVIAVADDLYGRSSPPVAALLARATALRAIARQTLAPLVRLLPERP